MSAAVRGVRAAAALGLRRAVRRPGRWLGVALGVALAAALLWGAGAEGTIAGDRAARGVLAHVGPGESRALLTWNGGAGPAVDREARGALRAMGAGRAGRGLLMAATRVGGVPVRLAAVAPLAPALRLLDGRPARGACLPRRCEVVRLAGSVPPPRLADRGVTLVVTGRAALTDPRPLGFTTTLAASDGGAPGPALLAAADPAGLEALSGLARVARTQAWSAPVALADLHAWQLGDELRRLQTVGARLAARSEGFTVSAPTGAIGMATDRARAAPGRVRAAALGLAAALAAFLALAAGSLRTGSRAEDARLRRQGATVAQRTARVLGETAVPVAAGLLAGSAAGVVAAAALAGAAGLGAGPVLAAQVGPAVVAGVLSAAAGWALVLAVVALPPRTARTAAAGVFLVTGAALAALLAVRPPGASAPLAAATVPLALVAGALLLAGAAPAILRAVARASPRRRPVARVALLELARVPGPPALAAAGTAAALALTLFALALDATLVRSHDAVADQRVALGAMVGPGAATGSPLARRTAGDWARLSGARVVAGVLRRQAFAVVGPTREPLRLLGVPAADLGRPAGLRPRALGRAPARRLTAAPFDRPPAGARLPPRAGRVGLAARVHGDAVQVTLFVTGRDGRTDAIGVGRATGAPRMLSARLPSRDRGGLVTAIGVRPPPGLEITQTHQLAEGGSGPGAAGSVALTQLVSGGRHLALAGWRGHGGLRGPAAALRHDPSAGTDAVVRPAAPSDTAALPVLADPATARDAGPGGTLGIEVGAVTLRARVAGVVERVPTVPGGARVVLADARVAARALDAASPGAGTPDELWFGGPARAQPAVDAAVTRAARRGGFTVRTRAAVLAALAREPVGRAARRTAWVAAVLALLLVPAGALLLTGRLRRDGAPGLRDLEQQGVGPGALRGVGRLHALAGAAVAVPGGLLLGTALASLAAGAARATLGAAPDPPLSTGAAWRALAIADLAGAALLLVVLGALAARAAHRGRAA